MSDWAVGDLATPAQAIRAQYAILSGIETGGVYTVAGLVDMHTDDPGLIIAGHPSPHETRSWAAYAFRKIRPDEHEACETEFVTLPKRSKRKVDA